MKADQSAESSQSVANVLDSSKCCLEKKGLMAKFWRVSMSNGHDLRCLGFCGNQLAYNSKSLCTRIFISNTGLSTVPPVMGTLKLIYVYVYIMYIF